MIYHPAAVAFSRPWLPDLQVTRVQAPSTASSGQPIQINWTIANNGNDGTKSSGWYDEVLLSSTPVLDQNAIYIGRFENFSALNAGEGYTNSTTYTLPRGISGAYYVFVRTDRFNSERERDENNNLKSSGAMAVTLSPYPDLQVAAATATNNAFSGDSIEVRWTVQNHGTGRTEPDNWFDTIFLSDDDSLNFAFIGRNNIRINETQLGIIKHSGALEVGQSYTTTAKMRLPHTIFGTRYVFVYTDIRGGATQAEEGGVYEYNFNLNNWRSDSINIRLRPTPDLVAKPAQAPGAASLGEDIAVSWTVENQGADETFESSWQDLVYLSRSAAFRLDSAVVLGAFTRNGKLKRDSSYTASRTVRVPSGFSGVNYFFVHTDWSNNVFEYQSDGNNISPTGAAIVINNPDFAVRSVTIPGAASSGKSIEIVWSVINNGPGAGFNMFWNDRVYLSRLPVFNPDSATVIGTFSRSGALRKDSSYTVTRAHTLPNGLSGDYYVFVETNSDRRVFENQAVSNNRGRSDNAMRVQLSPWPDLQVTSLQVPDSLNAGGRMAVTWTVHNRGVAATEAAAWTDRVYLSPGATWNPNNAILLASAERTRGLESNASYTQSRTVTLSTNLAGNYIVTVQTDANNNVYEHTDEGNNLTHSSPRAISAYPPSDLAVSELARPDSALSGSTIAVSWRVTNIGPATTLAQSWSDQLYFSTDTQLDPNRDLLMATVARSGALRSQENYLRQLNLTLANGFFGDYYLIVVSDAGGAVNDADRSNNVTVSTKRIHIDLAPSPDLAITSLRLPAQVNAGQPLLLTYTVANHGNGGLSNRTWFDAVYLSQNATLDNADQTLATRQRNLALPPSASYTDSLEVEMPGHASGTYFLIMKTDSRNDIYEHNAELNNVRVGDSSGVNPIVVIQPAPADLIVSSITIPANAFPGEEVTIAWTLKNIGENRATGRLRDAVYISADTIFQAEDPVFGVLTHDIDLPPNSSVQLSMKVNLTKLFRADAEGNLTEELPGLTPGKYHALVRTDIRRNIRESNTENNTLASVDLMDTDVPELRLGVPEVGTLTEGKKLYYRVNVDADLDLRLKLTSAATSASNEIYVAYDRAPTVVDYDFAGREPFSANQEVLVPTTKVGAYYVMLVTRNSTSSSSDFTLLGETLPFSVFDITPDAGGSGGRVTTTIRGAGFRNSIAVYLKLSVDSLVAGQVLANSSSVELKVLWDLKDIALGTYDVVLKNKNGSTINLVNGFTVENKIETVEMNLVGADFLRTGTDGTYEVHITNLSNIDLDYLLLNIESPDQSLFIKQVINSAHIIVFDAVSDTLPQNAALFYIPSLPSRKNTRLLVKFTDVTSEQLQQFESNERTKVRNSYALPVIAVGAALWNIGKAVLVAYIADFTWNTVKRTLYPRCHNVTDAEYLTSLTNQALEETNAVYGGEAAEIPVHQANDLVMEEAAKFYGEEATYRGWKKLISLRDYYDKFKEAFDILNLPDPTCIGEPDIPSPIEVERAQIRTLTAIDPNDITGPTGFGDERWITATQTLPYTIHFENDSTRATAAAQVVTITQKLDSTLDARSFRLGSFGFANLTFSVPENRAFYSTRLDVRDSLDVFVDVTAGIDVTTNEAFWIFKAIDPATGQQPVFNGFLPVNDALHRGEGFANYTIRPKRNAKTGDVVNAKARIVFDTNEPLDTPEIFNTIDAVVPKSRVTALPAAFNKNTLTVSWSGADDATGSQIRDFALYVSADGKPFELLEEGIADTSLVFSGDFGSTYRFFTIVRDNAGNIEALKTIPEASVTLDPTVAVAENKVELPKTFALYQNYPNPFWSGATSRSAGNPTTIIKYDLPVPSEVKLEIFDLLGRRVRVLVDAKQTAGFHSALWDGKTEAGRSVATGVYFYRIQAKGFVKARKMLLVR
jgi:hypothetical protein